MFTDVIIIAAVSGFFALCNALVWRWGWLKEAS